MSFLLKMHMIWCTIHPVIRMEILYIIVPCYNEEECLPVTVPIFRKKLHDLTAGGAVSAQSRVLFVDDGSADQTWEIIRTCHEKDASLIGLRLSPNQGHQNAVMAGLMEARRLGAVTVSIDADLQDDINAIDEMLKKHAEGYHIVCGVRSSRKTDTFLKRFTAQAYYAGMNLLGAKLIFNHADFRLMDKTALDKLALYHGDTPFLRGLTTRLGLNWATVSYDRSPRAGGESKYSLKKMVYLAMKGMACGRQKPLEVPRPEDPHIVERLYS